MRPARDDHSTLDRGHYEGIQKPPWSQLKRGGGLLLLHGGMPGMVDAKLEEMSGVCGWGTMESCYSAGDDRVQRFSRFGGFEMSALGRLM